MFSGADMPSSAFPLDGCWGFDGFAMTLRADRLALAGGLWVRFTAFVDALVFAVAAGVAPDVPIVGVGATLAVDFGSARLG
jgi:hypothetical protein